MNQRAGSLKKIKKIDKTLARPTKKKERKSRNQEEVSQLILQKYKEI